MNIKIKILFCGLIVGTELFAGVSSHRFSRLTGNTYRVQAQRYERLGQFLTAAQNYGHAGVAYTMERKRTSASAMYRKMEEMYRLKSQKYIALGRLDEALRVYRRVGRAFSNRVYVGYLRECMRRKRAGLPLQSWEVLRDSLLEARLPVDERRVDDPEDSVDMFARRMHDLEAPRASTIASDPKS